MQGDVTKGAHAAERVARKLRSKAPKGAPHPKGRMPGRSPRGAGPSRGLQKLSAAEKSIGRKFATKAAGKVAGAAIRGLGAAGAIYGAYKAGQAVGQALVKSAESHHMKQIEHTRKHYANPKMAAETRRKMHKEMHDK